MAAALRAVACASISREGSIPAAKRTDMRCARSSVPMPGPNPISRTLSPGVRSRSSITCAAASRLRRAMMTPPRRPSRPVGWPNMRRKMTRSTGIGLPSAGPAHSDDAMPGDSLRHRDAADQPRLRAGDEPGRDRDEQIAVGRMVLEGGAEDRLIEQRPEPERDAARDIDPAGRLQGECDVPRETAEQAHEHVDRGARLGGPRARLSDDRPRLERNAERIERAVDALEAWTGDDGLGGDELRSVAQPFEHEPLVRRGRAERDMAAFARKREPFFSLGQQGSDAEAGPGTEDRARSAALRSGTTERAQVALVQHRERVGNGFEIVDRVDAAEAETAADLVEAEAPVAVGEPDLAALDRTRHREHRGLRAEIPLAEVAANRRFGARYRFIIDDHEAVRTAARRTDSKARGAAADIGETNAGHSGWPPTPPQPQNRSAAFVPRSPGAAAIRILRISVEPRDPSVEAGPCRRQAPC